MGTTVDAQMEINLHGPYFEANRGWDIKGGVAATGSNAHLVNLFGFFAQSSSQGEIKEPGYGFFHGTRTNGAFVGGRLSGYTVADGFKTYSFDGTCQISMLGPQGNINDTNAPIYRDIVEWAPLTAYLQNDVRQNQGKEYVCITAGTSAASGGPVTTAADIPDGTAHWAYRGIALNSYGRGMIEWVNADGDKVLYGRYMARAGGPGTDASIALRRFASTTTGPSNGTATAGDVAFNRFAGFGRPIGWAATVAGTPGTWIPLGFIPSVSGNFGDTNQTLTSPIEPIVRWATTLTANRTVTLSTTGALRGQTVRVVRTGLGAFTLDVGPGLKTIPKSTAAFVDVAFDGSAWVLTGYGAL
jgi:hypothetical protein